MRREQRTIVRDAALDEWKVAVGGGFAIVMAMSGALVGLGLAGARPVAITVFDLLEFWCVTTALSSLAHGVWSSLAVAVSRGSRDALLRVMLAAVMFSGIGSLVMILAYLFVLDRVPDTDLRNIVGLVALTLPLQIGAVRNVTAHTRRQNPWDLDDDG